MNVIDWGVLVALVAYYAVPLSIWMWGKHAKN